MSQQNHNLRIGWAQTDITPSEPVLIAGQFNARVSEGVENPLTATALALQTDDDHVVLVGCDVLWISDELRDRVRSRVSAGSQNAGAADLDLMKIVLNATHTHTAPELHLPSADNWSSTGIDLDAMDVEACLDFMAERLADMILRAWTSRASGGGVAFGLGHAVIGHNRRWINDRGQATMYNLDGNTEFRHIEGYEDHSLNLLATYDAGGKLSGVVVNVPAPSQVTEGNFTLSADYWHETRRNLRSRLGEDLFILPQCSPAGDQAPRPLYEKQAHERMLELQGITQREALARRIVDAVQNILSAIDKTIDRNPVLSHQVDTVKLPGYPLTQADVDDARRQADALRVRYEQEKQKLTDNPELRDQPRWYGPATTAYRQMRWHKGVIRRFERQETGQAGMSVEIHTMRLGPIALASVPFEYYLDFGIQIKVRSPAIQTFLVQLAGNGTYLPSPRSVIGKGYGSVPGSAHVGPLAGQILADHILDSLDRFFERSATNRLHP